MKNKFLSIIIACTMTTPAIGFFYSEGFVSISAVFTGAGISSGLLLAQVTVEKRNQAKKELALYMKKNHSSLVRDILMARGPSITDWGSQMGMNVQEQAKLEYRIEGSIEQMKMLESLSGNIELDDAEVFSQSLVSLLIDVIGEKRIKARVQLATTQ